MSREPFHQGEIAVQERTGERELAVRLGAGILTHIAPNALPFLARQRLVALSIVGDDGRLWTSVWSGEPGFVQTPDDSEVHIDLRSAALATNDPVAARILPGRDIGMLGIELATRRRIRINGTIAALSSDSLRIGVREYFSNCPKYIQRREPHEDTRAAEAATQPWGQEIDDRRRALIERADTAFVGSVNPERGVDTSHRGGRPGFIEVVDRSTLRVPDYRGNSMFMTLGNFAADPRASLAVLDFDGGRVVSLSGIAQLVFGREDPQHPTGGTGRYWEFSVQEWTEFPLPAETRWELVDSSPFNPVPAAK